MFRKHEWWSRLRWLLFGIVGLQIHCLRKNWSSMHHAITNVQLNWIKLGEPETLLDNGGNISSKIVKTVSLLMMKFRKKKNSKLPTSSYLQPRSSNQRHFYDSIAVRSIVLSRVHCKNSIAQSPPPKKREKIKRVHLVAIRIVITMVRLRELLAHCCCRLLLLFHPVFWAFMEYYVINVKKLP